MGLNHSGSQPFNYNIIPSVIPSMVTRGGVWSTSSGLTGSNWGTVEPATPPETAVVDAATEGTVPIAPGASSPWVYAVVRSEGVERRVCVRKDGGREMEGGEFSVADFRGSIGFLALLRYSERLILEEEERETCFYSRTHSSYQWETSSTVLLFKDL